MGKQKPLIYFIEIGILFFITLYPTESILKIYVSVIFLITISVLNIYLYTIEERNKETMDRSKKTKLWISFVALFLILLSGLF